MLAGINAGSENIPKPINLSSKPLKSFNWTKIPPIKIKDTVFATLDDADIHRELADTYNELEELFAAKEIKSDTIRGSNESLGLFDYLNS